MRIRTVKPEFWFNVSMSTVHAESALLAIGLLNYCDDEGYFRAHEKLVMSALFPIRELSTSIRRCFAELSRIGWCVIVEGSDGQPIGRVVNFLKHQRIDRPGKSHLRPLWTDRVVSFDDDSTNTRRVIDEPSLPEWKGKEEEKEGEPEGGSAPAVAGPCVAQPSDPPKQRSKRSRTDAAAQLITKWTDAIRTVRETWQAVAKANGARWKFGGCDYYIARRCEADGSATNIRQAIGRFEGKPPSVWYTQKDWWSLEWLLRFEDQNHVPVDRIKLALEGYYDQAGDAAPPRQELCSRCHCAPCDCEPGDGRSPEVYRKPEYGCFWSPELSEPPQESEEEVPA